MSFADEITDAAADIGDQLHEGTTVTVTNPPPKAAGTLDTTTLTRPTTGDAATFPARRATAANERAGGEAGSRAGTALFIAEAVAVAAGQAAGSSLTASTIASGATLTEDDTGNVWTISGTTLEGGMVRIGCRKR